VMMTELIMDRGSVRALIDVSYESEPLLGFRVPVEMRERYLTRTERIDGVARYGKFRQFQVRTDEAIETPDGTKRKPPAGKLRSREEHEGTKKARPTGTMLTVWRTQ
jgi:hypothetical protein